MKKKIIWQDWVLMIGGFIFAPSLIISIIGQVHIPVATSLPTAIVLVVFAVTVFTLGLRLAALCNTLTAICWFILLSQAL